MLTVCNVSLTLIINKNNHTRKFSNLFLFFSFTYLFQTEQANYCVALPHISRAIDEYSFYIIKIWLSSSICDKTSFLFIFLLINSFNFLQFYCLLLFILGSSNELYTEAEFFTSFCAYEGMLNATENAACNFLLIPIEALLGYSIR